MWAQFNLYLCCSLQITFILQRQSNDSRWLHRDQGQHFRLKHHIKLLGGARGAWWVYKAPRILNFVSVSSLFLFQFLYFV